MLMSDIRNNRNIAVPAEELSALTVSACKKLRNGDIVGTYCSGSFSESGFWVKGRVIGNDTRDCILFVQEDAEPMQSFWYNEGDEVVKWSDK